MQCLLRADTFSRSTVRPKKGQFPVPCQGEDGRQAGGDPKLLPDKSDVIEDFSGHSAFACLGRARSGATPRLRARRRWRGLLPRAGGRSRGQCRFRGKYRSRGRCAGGREAGFTLIEVVVAMAVGFLVIGLAYAAYGEASRHVSRWQGRVAAENALHLALRRFSEDVRSSAGALSVSSRALTLSRGDSRPPVRYVWKGGRLLREGRPATPAGVRVTSAAFREDSTTGSTRPVPSSRGRPSGALSRPSRSSSLRPSPQSGGGDSGREGGAPLLSLQLTVRAGGVSAQGHAVARPRQKTGGWGEGGGNRRRSTPAP